MYRIVRIVLAYLNFHTYIPFVVVLLFLADFNLVAICLFVCSRDHWLLLAITIITICMKTSMAVHQDKRRRQLNLDQSTG